MDKLIVYIFYGLVVMMGLMGIEEGKRESFLYLIGFFVFFILPLGGAYPKSYRPSEYNSRCDFFGVGNRNDHWYSNDVFRGNIIIHWGW